MSDMIERLARAMCSASGDEWKSGTMQALTGTDHVQNKMVMEDHDLDVYNNHWRHKARAVLEAMKEPTDAMLAASGQYNKDRMAEVWRAMISKALEG